MKTDPLRGDGRTAVFAGGPHYSFTSFDVPGAVQTWVFGIKHAGTIVGGFRDSSGVANGF